MTTRHETIREALAAAGTFTSAQELYALLRESGHRIGLTTVYRALAAMVDAAEADVISADGEQVYRTCRGRRHHHHLICRACRKTIEVAAPAVERWAETAAANHGYSCLTHTIEIFGTCNECTDQSAASACREAPPSR